MLLPPISKTQKITLIVTAIFIIVCIIGFCNKPKTIVVNDNQTTFSNSLIDSLKLNLREQQKLNLQYVNKIDVLEKRLDSIANLMEENKKKLTTIKKRKTDDSKVTYNAWTDNEFTRFFSNRYQGH